MFERKVDKGSVPFPSVRRFPLYLTVLEEFKNDNKEWISTTDFSEVLSLKPIQVRKDLAHTGIIGKPKKGFIVEELISTINSFLGWNRLTKAFLIGSGALGSALLGYSGLKNHGLDIVAAFDISRSKIGSTIHGKKIYPITNLKEMAEKMQIRLGIITVPRDAAQNAADALIQAGIKGIWNFSPMKIQAPNDVVIQREDLSSGLAVLSIKLSQNMR